MVKDALVWCHITMAANGSQAYLVSDLNAQNFKFRTNEHRRTELE
jgi:hypothetical protein